MKTITTADGHKHLFSVPITQSLTKEEHEHLKGEKKIVLRCTKVSPHPLAIIENPVFFENRKEEISTRTFGTFSQKHPKVERIMAQGDFLVSGSKTRFIHEIKFNDGLDQYRLTPVEVNNLMKEKNADVVYAFQVRNPLHNGHVLLLNDTREQLLKKGHKNPILLLHPLGGWTKEDDAPLDTRIKQHQALLDDGTLNPDHVILAIWPSPMYYAGPTEVLWHASSRTNCGITHFITGRDPAGMRHPEADKDLYDVWHGQKLLVHVKSLLNNVEVLPFKVAALHKEHQKMEFVGAGSNNADFDFISGTRMRTMAKNNENPPTGFMSQKGWDVLADYYRTLQ
jgi:3'-phosphoadenosine 5'-phosphosulfate synthase